MSTPSGTATFIRLPSYSSWQPIQQRSRSDPRVVYRQGHCDPHRLWSTAIPSARTRPARGTVDLLTGQAILRGSNGFIVTDQGLVLTHGRLVLDVDRNVISITGQQTGVCAALGTR